MYILETLGRCLEMKHSFGGDENAVCAAIFGRSTSLDIAARGEPSDDIRDVGTVDPEFTRERRLIDPGIRSDNAQCAKLYGSDVEIAHLLHEYRNADLVKSTHQKARAFQIETDSAIRTSSSVMCSF